MRLVLFATLALALPLGGVTLQAQDSPAAAAAPKSVEFYQRIAAEKFNSRLALPVFETTPEAIEKTWTDARAAADKSLDKIGAQTLPEAAFATTIGALDDLHYLVGNVANRFSVIKESSTDPKLRAAAEEAIKKIQDWAVGVDYREDVYAAVQAYAKTEPKLEGEDARLLEFTLRDFKRAGLTLPPDARKEVERERKELAALETDFESNVTAAVAPVTFTRAELAGVPAEFLDSPKIKTGADQYTVAANQTFQYLIVEENAKSEATRKKLYVARDNMAREKNPAVFNKILALRNSIALRLGYQSWADYQIEPKMAKTAATAEKFIDDLIAGTQPKFDEEVAEMQKLKAADTNNPQAKITTWDWRYYQNQIKKTRYTIDTEALRVYFPMPKVLAGMFKIYEHDFGLKFQPVAAPYKWVENLQLFVCEDAATGEPMGLFYLDLYPREGKYNHFAEFGLIDGKLLPDGKYQRPVCALLCNFSPPSGDKPSLLNHEEVVTIFHEFGHALHAMLTRAKFARFAGTNVPTDFVEAPSQMLENWAWDKTVLDSFAADYRDPSKKIPAEILGKMREAKLATAGVFYRRQFAFAALDLALHDAHPRDQPFDAVATSNQILEKVFLPIDPNTAFLAGFGHLAGGYDAGYYGYAWAESIAADMATVFEKSKNGFMDKDAGLKLRYEIYEPGNSRDVNVSIEKFLGRPPSNVPFLRNNLGIKAAARP